MSLYGERRGISLAQKSFRIYGNKILWFTRTTFDQLQNRLARWPLWEVQTPPCGKIVVNRFRNEFVTMTTSFIKWIFNHYKSLHLPEFSQLSLDCRFFKWIFKIFVFVFSTVLGTNMVIQYGWWQAVRVVNVGRIKLLTMSANARVKLMS